MRIGCGGGASRGIGNRPAANAAAIAVSDSDVPMALTRGEGHAVAARWLAEARVAQEVARFALPPSRAHLGAGGVVALGEAAKVTGRVVLNYPSAA